MEKPSVNTAKVQNDRIRERRKKLRELELLADKARSGDYSGVKAPHGKSPHWRGFGYFKGRK